VTTPRPPALVPVTKPLLTLYAIERRAQRQHPGSACLPFTFIILPLACLGCNAPRGGPRPSRLASRRGRAHSPRAHARTTRPPDDGPPESRRATRLAPVCVGSLGLVPGRTARSSGRHAGRGRHSAGAGRVHHGHRMLCGRRLRRRRRDRLLSCLHALCMLRASEGSAERVSAARADAQRKRAGRHWWFGKQAVVRVSRPTLPSACRLKLHAAHSTRADGYTRAPATRA
jgi:hypothetical protein